MTEIQTTSTKQNREHDEVAVKEEESFGKNVLCV